MLGMKEKQKNGSCRSAVRRPPCSLVGRSSFYPVQGLKQPGAGRQRHHGRASPGIDKVQKREKTTEIVLSRKKQVT